ncbi:Methyltransferase-like protein 17, partial [Diplonema papillatum]
FKLVIDARQTILEEYGGIGPWETQPTVVAPCPHDNLRCPVAYSLQGRSHKKLRTCHSTARYSPSFVENWVRGAHETFRDEEYSYCVLGRNEVAPEKSLRPPPKREIRPTVITENPAKAGDDPRIKKVLESPEELAMWHSHGNRRKVEADLYEPELYLPVPETEENLNPFTGKYRKYGKNATAKDVITAYKEAAEYTEEYRKRSWNWDRVVRPTRTGKLGNVTIDVCTPHATQERFTVIRNREKLDKLAAAAMPGSLFPYYTGTARYEFVQGDAPNTFAQPDSHLNPIEHQKLAEAVQSAQKEEEADADDETFSAEDVAWKRSMQQRLDNAASDPDLAEEIRAELKTLRYHPK